MTNNTALLIQKEAFRLFRERGYKNVKIEDICEAVSITKSTFYYHYKTKDSLLANFAQGAGKLPSSLFSTLVTSDDPWDQLWASLTLALEWAIEDAGKELTAQVFIYDLKNNVFSFADRHRVMELHTSLIRKGQQSCRFGNKQDPTLLYQCLSSIYISELFKWACGSEEEFDKESFKQKVVATLVLRPAEEQ